MVVGGVRLDEMLAKAFPLFDTATVLPAFNAAARGAINDVELRRIVPRATLPDEAAVRARNGGAA